MKIKQGERVKLAFSILACVGLAWANGPELDLAHKLYNLTEFQRSLEVLHAVPNKDAAVYALMGRDYYGQGEFKKATESLEKAVALEPGNSDYNLWLGRAYGRRAETSSMVTAPGFASKARQFFERAAQLNPYNLDAQSDLFEYYLEAPGFLGGGFDKASATAAQIARINPAEGHWAQAKLAEKRKRILQRGSAIPAGLRDCPPTDRTPHRSGAPVHETGPVPRCRPESGEGRADRAEQSEADVRASRSLHQKQAKS